MKNTKSTLHFVRKNIQAISMFMLITFLQELFFPTMAYALTGGLSQPEVQSFEPAGTSEMVDLFSGDFNYNIPLLNVEGYPINIAYHAGISMDQEASWVGLGWNINPGVINRNMRGLPDDFSGDTITKEYHIKPNITKGLNYGVNFQLFGIEKPIGASLGLNFGIFTNNYKGIGYEFGVTPGISAGNNAKAKMTIGLGFNSQSGIDIDPSMNFSYSQITECDEEIKGGFQIGSGYNSRSGMKSLNMGSSLSMRYKNGEYIGGSAGVSGSGSPINFGTQTWTPNISMPMTNTSLSVHLTLGAAAYGTHPNMNLKGYYSKQELSTSEIKRQAFGYLYEQNKPTLNEKEEGVLLDFNREQDGPYLESSTNLPLANHTHDMYSVSGQGVGGMYRLSRGDLGILHSDQATTKSTGLSGGVELGVGGFAHVGADINVNFTNSTSGRWDDGNAYSGAFDFSAIGQNATYEPSYFRNAQEVTATDENFIGKIAGDLAVRPNIGLFSSAQKQMTHLKEDGSTYGQTTMSGNVTSNTKAKRETRNTVLSYLTANEAQSFALDKEIKSYPIPGSLSNPTIIQRTSGERGAHHLSEIKVTQPGGSRYVYGIAAYNNTQVEKTFAINALSNTAHATGQASYSGNENSMNNTSGDDNFYNKVTTPGYAHSYLLTGVLSPDYVDRTGDGITDDDLGTAVKMNYTRKDAAYKWRVPYTANEARFSEGLKSDDQDNKGSIVYGTKEIWHVHSIESKDQIAFFYTSPRRDGFGVNNENGGLDASEISYKLDKIVLYSKQDLGNPIKSVFFEYDYSLCPDVHNNNGQSQMSQARHNSPSKNINQGKGKLTLKKIYFTYGNSERGFFSPYLFDYNSPNPSYSLKDYDRWGMFKKELAISSAATDPNPTNSEFPYTVQDQSMADLSASAWSMTDVHLPSGGSIHVKYESDDYAYVQDKQTMQMIKLKGFGNSSSFTSSNELFNGNTQNTHLFFELQSPITGTNPKQQMYDKYLKGMKDLQFTVLANVDGKGNYEYVRAYAELDYNAGYGVSTSNPSIGWVVLKTVDLGDKNKSGTDQVNPISRAIWNYARLYTPKLLYPGSYLSSTSPANAAQVISDLQNLTSLKTEVQRIRQGFNRNIRSEGFGKKVILQKSWIRLYTPERIKLGGGHRVKQITMSDNWTKMKNSPSSVTPVEYGQVYEYTTTENGTTFSSGVAAYEPSIGNEENPWHQPQTTIKENKLAPNEMYMTDQPYGESHFPGPTIGYSKIKVASLPHAGVKKTATGYSINEFYTARDFPIKVKQTSVEQKRLKPEPFWSMFKIRNEDKMTVSQGYVIELNDMHGKPKKQYSYSESGTQISGVESIYHTQSGSKKLTNEVKTIAPNGSIKVTEMGVDYDFVTDMREEKSKSWSAGISGQIETIPAGIIPFPIPCIFPSFSLDNSQFNSAVSTKVVFRHGLLKTNIAFQEGSNIETENLLYDKETGAVLLTSVQNEHNDKTYSFTYPAHWAYEKGMGQAYKNIGITVENVLVGSDQISANIKPYLVPGDECIAIGQLSTQKVYVYDGVLGHLNFIKEDGYPLETGLYTIKVIRSGRRNMQSTGIGSVVTHKNPLVQSGSSYSLNFSEILHTQAAEFKENWSSFIPKKYLDHVGEEIICEDQMNKTINPFTSGLRGNWRFFKNYTYVGERNHDPSSVDTRNDGTYTTYNPFWTFSSGTYSPSTSANWIWASEVTQYSPFGQELENKDALNRHSAELFGYNHALVTAVGSNAEYNELAYDGFEDYEFSTLSNLCPTYHWNFKKDIGTTAADDAFIDNAEAHTGKHSIRILQNKTHSVLSDFTQGVNTSLHQEYYDLQPQDQIGQFTPKPGEKYILSAWVKEDVPATTTTYGNTGLRIEIKYYTVLPTSTSPLGTFSRVLLAPSGNIIEGWQRINTRFTIPTGTQGIAVVLHGSQTANSWFDDIRIHPAEGNMKSYAYDYQSLRLMATMDENNYATLYEYDKSGALIRIKKETIKGIQTLQENRNGLSKVDVQP